MKRAHRGNKILSPRGNPRKLERCLHGFRSRIAEENPVQAWNQRRDLLHQHGALVVGERLEQSDQRVRLLVERLRNFRVGVTEVGNTVSRRAIQLFHAVYNEQRRALSAHNGQSLFGIHARSVFIFGIYNLLCVHWITVPFPAKAFEIGF